MRVKEEAKHLFNWENRDSMRPAGLAVSVHECVRLEQWESVYVCLCSCEFMFMYYAFPSTFDTHLPMPGLLPLYSLASCKCASRCILNAFTVLNSSCILTAKYAG